MVFETVVSAAPGGLLGSGALGYLNLRATRVQMRAERATTRGEYYLERKVEALIDVQSELKCARREYKRHADKAGHSEEGISQAEYDELIEVFDDYREAIDEASIFLDEDQFETLLEIDLAIRDTHRFLKKAVDYPTETDYSEFDLAEFNDRFDAGEEMLKAEVKEPVDQLDISPDSDVFPHRG